MGSPFLAFLIAIVLTPIVAAALRRRGILDTPNERSSHDQPTPRGGGFAPAVAIVIALFAPGSFDGQTRTALLVAAGAFGLIGLVEDLVGVPVLWRFALQLGAGLGAGWLAIGAIPSRPLMQIFAVVIATLFVIAYVNAFNFMDGINGISALQAAVAGGAWYVLGEAEGAEAFAVGGAIVAAAALGFAPFNFPRAQVFLGDVGSYAIGASLAVLAVLGLRAGIPPEAVIAPLAVYLADTGMTLVRRVLRGDPWYRPHRDHTYQRLVRAGWSHTRTTLVVGVVMLTMTALGAVSLAGAGVVGRVAADLAILAVLAAYLATPSAVRSRRPEPVLA